MKPSFSGHAVASKFANVKRMVGVSAAVAFAVMGSMAANAQATAAEAQYCHALTPANLGKLTTALEAARVASFNAAALSGFDPNATSTYPIAYVNTAQSAWSDPEAFHNLPRHAAYLTPYITNISIAGELSGTPNIELMQSLVHARWWARAMAYNWAYNVAPSAAIVNAYLDAHKKIQAAVDLTEAIGFTAASCALNQTQPSNPARHVLTREVTALD